MNSNDPRFHGPGQQFPANSWQPEPRPPVSGHYMGPHDDDNGPTYGTQQRAVWFPGATDTRQVIDAKRSVALWRLSVFGRVDLKITYGTLGTRSVLSVRAPVVMTVPGQLIVDATPIDDAGTECTVTLTQATAGARSIARQFVTGPVNLDDGATDFWALTACSLTISGVVVAVPALQIAPLVVGSVLTSGSGFQEFET